MKIDPNAIGMPAQGLHQVARQMPAQGLHQAIRQQRGPSQQQGMMNIIRQGRPAQPTGQPTMGQNRIMLANALQRRFGGGYR